MQDKIVTLNKGQNLNVKDLLKINKIIKWTPDEGTNN